MLRSIWPLSSASCLTAARFDVALTVSTKRYVSDLRIGRINPQHFDLGLSSEQKKYDLAHFLICVWWLGKLCARKRQPLLAT